MLTKNNTIQFDPKYTVVDGHIIFSHIKDLSTDADPQERLVPDNRLEYVFQLIRSSFLHVTAYDNYLPPHRIHDKDFYQRAFFVLSLPFGNETNKAEVEQWNDLVEIVSRDFEDRVEKALRGKCSYEQLLSFVQDQIENFDYDDRKRLDPEKLMYLVVFVFDYCMLTMREARLHPGLDSFVTGKVTIRNKTYSPPLRVCASLVNYEPYSYEPVDGYPWPFENYDLPKVVLNTCIKNPHASDSNCSAMFVDLMHKFFLSFGLRKRKGTEWANAEKKLIYDSLRLFGLCRSNQPAEKSKYVTTVINDYGDYFVSCNLRTWIREGQAYCYLMACSVEDFVRESQKINSPFISLDDYSVIKAAEKEVDEKAVEPQERTIPPEELPDDLRIAQQEIGDQSLVITHSKNDRVAYAVITKKANSEDRVVEWNPKLEYVKALIDSAFEYITLLPVIPQLLVVRNDLSNQGIQARLCSLLERDLLGRMESIPRGKFNSDTVMAIIKGFHYHMNKREDRDRFDDEKFYTLFLFIFDYVCLNYEESVISPHVKKFVPSKLNIEDESYTSTVLIDEMLMYYLEHLDSWERGDDESKLFQQLAEGRLYVPSAKDSSPIRHPSCSVKNMTAMFYDLFVRFFRALGLSKRSDVKYLSDQESMLVAELANCCGICVTENKSSARTMFMTNKDYFEKSSLALSIRENEYGYLLMNTMSDVLFNAKTELEK